MKSLRTHGVHQVVRLQVFPEGAPSETHILLDSDFDPNHQIFHPLINIFASALDDISVGCSWVNNGPDAIHFGESESDELCLSALYSTPSYDVAFPAGLDDIGF
jgi:hypothetical protein